MPDDQTAFLPALPEAEPAMPGPLPFATFITTEGRPIRLFRDGAGLRMEIATGKGIYEPTLDKFQAGAFRAAMAEG